MTNNPNGDATHSAGDSRRTYEPPAIEDTAVFETLAVACGKTVGTAECAFEGYSAS